MRSPCSGQVTSSPLTKGQRRELGSRGTVVVQASVGSELDRWLREGRATAAIVRPDRTVMQAGKDTAAICRAVPAFSGADGAPAGTES